MAPSAIYNGPVNEDGVVLEAISDAVDEVNMLKAQTAFAQQPQFDSGKNKTAFRQYEAACDRVRAFYVEQHARQTVAYNVAARQRFHSAGRARAEMTVWQAIEKLDALVDDSDPDTQLSQMQHLLQSAEAIRRDGKPRWMQLVGLIHDLGKLMLFLGGADGQWDVVGDTFPVGCAFAGRAIIYPDTFAANPDASHPVYGSAHGIYSPGCGIANLVMSWGHDEYLYLVVRDQARLPREALAMIRYHSFYPWHREGAYREFMADGDEDLLQAVRAFNPYDLYSKSDGIPSVEELKPYYLELIDEFFPQQVIKW
ncbi:inositol oxygenase [Lasiosphaeria miniovina]|uniref:Inositol oxygenase n=1 Tax=Lasiosphaeria miniovina TaxID=1954250 RepID=A0AA40B6W3_9PEZI|nr:inositol oxygenase [Lasiosphaeria miniovina]KAK0728791.1 inositol oxygenase [Lasiosphaeria miniovina]